MRDAVLVGRLERVVELEVRGVAELAVLGEIELEHSDLSPLSDRDAVKVHITVMDSPLIDTGDGILSLYRLSDQPAPVECQLA